MFNKLFLPFAVAVLLVVNIALVVAYYRNESAIERSWKLLDNEEEYQWYADLQDALRRDAWNRAAYDKDSALVKFFETSNALSGFIDSLTQNESAKSSHDFFTSRVSLTSPEQEKLLALYRAYNLRAIDYLEHSAPKKVELVRKMKNEMDESFLVLQRRAEAAAPGYYSGDVGLKDRWMHKIQFKKDAEGVHWSGGYKEYAEVSEWFRVRSQPVQIQQARGLVTKLEDIFSRPGKAIVFGDEYNMAGMSRAEMLSMLKHVTAVKGDVDNSIRQFEHNMLVLRW